MVEGLRAESFNNASKMSDRIDVLDEFMQHAEDDLELFAEMVLF